MAFQYTLSSAVEIEGIGLHTGEQCRCRLMPAAAETGLKFVAGGIEVPARVDFVETTRRATILGVPGGQGRISTVEHLLAALSGLQVDNALLQVEGPEIPVYDGSAKDIAEKIRDAGRRRQKCDARFIRLARAVRVERGASLLSALPANELRISYSGDFPHMGKLNLNMKIGPQIFLRQIAPARTFVAQEEVEKILERGLGQGGSLDNVVVLGAGGPSCPLRFDDEPLRHKILDLLGDLALLGGRLCAHVTAVNAGHELNIELARKILQAEAR